MPCSYINRRVRSATQCAGTAIPYGSAYAGGPDTVLTGGAWPKRPYCPCASARKTHTYFAYPATIAAAAFPTAPEPPPPPPPHIMLEKRSAGSPSAAARREASLRSLEYDANPSISVTEIPASVAAFVIASIAS